MLRGEKRGASEDSRSPARPPFSPTQPSSPDVYGLYKLSRARECPPLSGVSGSGGGGGNAEAQTYHPPPPHSSTHSPLDPPPSQTPHRSPSRLAGRKSIQTQAAAPTAGTQNHCSPPTLLRHGHIGAIALLNKNSSPPNHPSPHPTVSRPCLIWIFSSIYFADGFSKCSLPSVHSCSCP